MESRIEVLEDTIHILKSELSEVKEKLDRLSNMVIFKEDAITDKQFKVIKHIEENLGVKFQGRDKEDARKFISKNMKKSKEVSEDVRKIMENPDNIIKTDDGRVMIKMGDKWKFENEWNELLERGLEKYNK